MNNTIRILLTLLFASFICGCEKPECKNCNPYSYDNMYNEIIGQGLNPVTMYLAKKDADISTKSKDTLPDDISGIDIFAFDSATGELDIHRHFGTYQEMIGTPIPVKDGRHTFVVLVNASKNLNGKIACLSDIHTHYLNVTDKELAHRFFCIQEILINGPVNVVFHVGHYHALINVNKVAVDFKNTIADKISDAMIHVLNVPYRVSFGGIVDRSVRANDGIAEEEFSDFLSYRLGTIANGSTVNANASFLVFEKCDGQNIAENKAIYVTVEGKVNGKTYYWPIPVNFNAYQEGVNGTPGIKANTVHNLNITITGLGGNAPDGTISFKEIGVECQVADWETCNDEMTF